jgi:hypothetical protein
MIQKIVKVVAIVAFLMLGWLTPLAAYGDGATITVEDAGKVSPGEEFKVSVSIKDNPGFAAAVFQLSYDREALELIGFGTDGLIAAGLVENIAEGSVAYLSMADLTENGVLFTVNFRVKVNAEPRDYSIQIGLKQNAAANLINIKTETVTVSFVAGSVSVDSNSSANNSGNNQGTASSPGFTPTLDFDKLLLPLVLGLTVLAGIIVMVLLVRWRRKTIVRTVTKRKVVGGRKTR